MRPVPPQEYPRPRVPHLANIGAKRLPIERFQEGCKVAGCLFSFVVDIGLSLVDRYRVTHRQMDCRSVKDMQHGGLASRAIPRPIQVFAARLEPSEKSVVNMTWP